MCDTMIRNIKAIEAPNILRNGGEGMKYCIVTAGIVL